jgi:purine-binding chemotaxis protein CheW
MAISDSNPTAAERALADYLDGLLHDDGFVDASLDLFANEAPRNPPPAANVTPLPTRRPPRLVEALKSLPNESPFAEPVRTLPLRMPPLAVAAQPEGPTPAEVVEAFVVAPSVPAPPQVDTPVVAAEPELRAMAKVSEEAAVESAAESAIESGADTLAWIDGRPRWAQRPFECLLFSAGGLKLAVPLVELGSIYPLERDDLTEIFGQVDWFLGLIRTARGNMRVVDSARVIMPERYQSGMPDDYRFVITLNDSDWGLGADALAGTTLLDPESVRWRSERSKRPWLAGTVVEKMCALLDPAQLNAMFNQLDRKRR